MDIMRLVDELETLVSKSPRVPFTANLIVNEDDLFDIIDQLRMSIPKEVKEAKRTEAERERILTQAQEESNRLINMAKEKIMTAVDDHELVDIAKQESNAILEQARKDANQLKTDAAIYVSDNLSELEEYLLKLLTTVRNGLRQLQATAPPPANTPNEDNDA